MSHVVDPVAGSGGAALAKGQPEVTVIDNAEQLASFETASDCRYDLWLQLLFSRPAQQWVSNVQTRWALLQSSSARLPVTINETEYGNSYVASPYTGCISYPKSEIEKLNNPMLELPLQALLLAMALPLRAGHINRVVCVNNWLLSTNLYPAMDSGLVQEATRQLVSRWPTHAIAWRSLNDITNRPLLNQLAAAGYLLAPSRQVYFFDGESAEYLRRPNCRWDQKLLARSSYRIVLHDEFTSADAPRIEQLYRWLYVDKYSPHNPQFTAEMFDECRRRRLLTLWGLRSETGELDGIVGTFDRCGVMTVPLVGYATSLPMKLGLYRMLMAIVLSEAARRKLLLNLSSGASHFKRLRGGRPSLEYTAVYCRHLSWSRRAIWRTLAGLLTHIGAPLLQKYEL